MRLNTFGHLALEGSGFTRQKPLLLLAYLAIEGPKPRRYLAELFFMDTRDPLNSLSRALSYLRSGAPGSVEADNTRAWAALACDATELLSAADAQDHRTCLNLYRGAFAEDVNLALGAELEEWLFGTREHFAGRHREVLLQRAEQEASAGGLAQAAAHAEAAYTLTGAPELEPDQFERIYTLLLAGNNPRSAEVRAEAEAFEIALKISSREAKVRFKAASDEKTPVPNNLLPPKTSFVGRDQELRVVAEQLADPVCRLLTLHGMGGVGKSRLATQAAREQLERGSFKDGAFFVPLDALNSADLIPASIAEAVGLELRGQEDVLTQVKRFIGEKQTLLVLDNYEHLIEAATLPATLLDACPKLKIFVTSREILNLQREWVLTLAGLPVPTDNDLTLETVQRFEAIQLFSQRAKHARRDFALTRDNLPHILKLCQLVGGNPLGLELAAVWVKLMPVAELSEEIQQNLDLLSITTRDIPDRHQSIRAAFEHSWKLLTPKEQEALRKLAVFRGGFSRGAAAEVADATLPVLASLLDKSLLTVLSNGRYDRHALLYQYTLEKLSEAPDIQHQARAKHQQYCLDFLRKRHQNPDSFSEIDAELSNLLHALETSLTEDKDSYLVEMMRLLVVGESYFAARGHTPRSLRLLELAVERAKALNELATAHYLVARLGDTHREALGNLGRAFEAFSEALALARELKDTHREIIMLSLLGVVRFEENAEDADEFLERAYQLAKTTKDNLALSRVLQNRSYLAYLKGDAGEMHRLTREAVDVARRLKNTPSVTQSEVDHTLFFTILNMGEAELLMGNFEDALACRLEALEIAQEHDNKIWMAYAFQEIGEMYHGVNERLLARENLSRALTLYRDNNEVVRFNKLSGFMKRENYQITGEASFSFQGAKAIFRGED